MFGGLGGSACTMFLRPPLEMTRVLLIISVLACTACKAPSTQNIELEPLRVTSEAIDFGDVWVGIEARQALRVNNPNEVRQPLRVVTTSGFEATGFPEELVGGEEVSGWVTLTATAPGVLEGVASVGDVQVTLRASALEVPTCVPSSACHVSSFDFEARACVETAAPDETSCTASSSCFLEARCRAGQCVGTSTTCNDGNPCTLDACGEDGCVYPDDSLSCPLPSNPCLAPACDAQQGCTSVEVEDGTPCGPRTCSLASICVSGQCTTRAAPQTQACTEVVAGVPAGPGLSDGRGLDARFLAVSSMVYLPNGDLYLAETSSTPRLRRVSPDGTVRTVAGGVPGHADGFGTRARFTWPIILGVDVRSNLVLSDVSAPNQPRSLRKMSPSGQVVTVCTFCLGDSRTQAGLLRNGDVIAFTIGSSGPIILSRRSSLGRVTTHATRNLNAFVHQLVAKEPLVVCAEANGMTRLVHLEEAAAGELRWQLGAPCRPTGGHELMLLDGGVEELAGIGPVDDGPLTQVGLEVPRNARAAFDFDGGYALFDMQRFHVRRVESGFMRTLAGPVPRQGVVDGMQSQLQTSPRALAADSSGAWFADGPLLRRLEVRTVTTIADAGLSGRDLAWTGSEVVWLGGQTYEGGFFSSADELTWFSPTGAVVSSRTTVRRDLVSIAAASDGGLLVAHQDETTNDALDAGYEPFFAASRVRVGGGDPRAYVVVPALSSLFAIGSTEDWTKPFLQEDAGTRLLTDFYEEAPGVLIGVRSRQVVRQDTVTGQRTVIAELTEVPSAIAPAPDGGAFVAIPHAILHVRF
jgi:hypothetical protein